MIKFNEFLKLHESDSGMKPRDVDAMAKDPSKHWDLLHACEKGQATLKPRHITDIIASNPRTHRLIVELHRKGRIKLAPAHISDIANGRNTEAHEELVKAHSGESVKSLSVSGEHNGHLSLKQSEQKGNSLKLRPDDITAICKNKGSLSAHRHIIEGVNSGKIKLRDGDADHIMRNRDSYFSHNGIIQAHNNGLLTLEPETQHRVSNSAYAARVKNPLTRKTVKTI